MFPHSPAALVAAVLLSLTPAAVRWWWGRPLVRLADDPILAERLAAHRRRAGSVTVTCAAVMIVGWPGYAAWAVPLQVLAQMVGGYPLRRALYRETWSFPGYLWFFLRMTAGVFGFWIVLASAPWLVWCAGRFDWIAGLVLAGGLVVWNAHYPDILRRLMRARPVTDPGVVARFEALVNTFGLPMPRFEYVPMDGGVVANAVALPSLKKSSVVFTETLLTRSTEDETIAICAHELAHLEYYNPARLGRMNAATCCLIAAGAAVAPVSRLVFHATEIAVPDLLWSGALAVALVLRAKHRQKNETASDLRAVQMTGDPEALASALTKLHTIARVPRRWDQQQERQATHPSLARRIRDIRAAAGVASVPLDSPRSFRAGAGAAAVTFEDSRLCWDEGTGVSHLVEYGTLVELRLRASATGAITLVAAEKSGRRWSMVPAAEDLPALQGLLDVVDGRLTHDASISSFSPLVSRLVAVFAASIGVLAGQFAPGLIALLAALLPAGALLTAAGLAAVAGAGLVLRDGAAGQAGPEVASMLVLLGIALLFIGRSRRAESSRIATMLVAALGACATIALVFIGFGGLNPIRLHQAARSEPGATVLLLALAGACLTLRRPVMRYAAAAAAVGGVLLSVIATTAFLDGVGRDPFLVAAPPVVWRWIDAPSAAQFDLSFEVGQLQLSPHGRLVAVTQLDDDEDESRSARFYLGEPGKALSEMAADDVAFVDDHRALLLVRHDGNAEVREVSFDGTPVVVSHQDIGRVAAHSIAYHGASNEWIVTGRDEARAFVRVSGTVGDNSQVRTAKWSAPSQRMEWIDAVAVHGSDAFVVEKQYVYGPLGGSRLAALAPLMIRTYGRSQMWRVHDRERVDAGHSLLDASCDSDVLDEGRVVCTAFDGLRTRVVTIDPTTGVVSALAMMDGRFGRTGSVTGGWLSGWKDSTPAALRLATREAFRPRKNKDEFVTAVTGADAVVGTVASIDDGSRVRVYPLLNRGGVH